MRQPDTKKSRQFGYEKVAQAIRGSIDAGIWKEGEQLPSLEDLIARFGYSRMTVFKALQLLESQGFITMGRGRGTFVRPQMARPTLGFVTRHLLDPPSSGFSALVARALEDRLHDQGWSLRLYTDSRIGGSGTASWELQEALEKRALQGLITLNSDLPRNFLRSREWLEMAVPHVDLSCHNTPYRIEWDDSAMGGMLVEACRMQNYTRIGIIGTEAPRLFAAVDAAGIGRVPGWQARVIQGIGYEESGYRRIRELWALPNRPQALFISDDVVAKGVMIGLLSLGVRVPEDIAIISNTNSGSDTFYPMPMIRIVIDTDGLAREFLSLMTEVIANPDMPPTVRRVTPMLQMESVVPK